MATTVGSGTQALTVTTEHSLDTEVTAGSFVLQIDTTPLADGATPDILEVRFKSKVLTGGTIRTWLLPPLIGAQNNPLWQSPPFVSMFSLEVTVTQTQGTGRSIDWALISL